MYQIINIQQKKYPSIKLSEILEKYYQSETDLK